MTKQKDNIGGDFAQKSKNKPNVQEALEVLNKTVAKNIPNKIAEIKKSWGLLQANTDNTDSIQLLHRQTHTLAGTMGTYGYEEIADCAKNIELVLQEFSDNPSELFPSAKLTILMDNLEKTAVLANRRKSPEVGLMSLPPVSSEQSDINRKVVYLIDDDLDFLNNMEIQISHFGYDVQTFSNLPDFDVALARKEPGIVVMDVMFGTQKNGGIEHITHINSQRAHPLTTIFITGGNDLSTRLDAVRANGNAYFTKPVIVEQLIDALDGLTHKKEEEPFRIVIIDDSIEQSSFTALTLEQAGMQTKVVNSPLTVLTVLAEYPADLILMDL
jgi:DNA-binding response OmpR family regulator